jgi:PAP2 superfamily
MFMNVLCRLVAVLVVVTLAGLGAVLPVNAAKPEAVLQTWYKLTLELVRHTPTYTPPVASRSFAYLGVTAFEAAASGSNELQSLAGQLNGLTSLPKRDAGKSYDEAVVMHAAMSFAADNFFENTGPTGHHAMAALEAKLKAEVSSDVASDVAARSEAYGRAVAAHILAWSQNDGGAVIENMGFPLKYELTQAPAHWTPTSTIALQQLPLLPTWGKNRAFAMPDGTACALPPPPEYSEDKNSEFYKQALEVFDAKANLTPEQRTIARFWSDDAMLSTTPPGHWISIALQIFERDAVPLDKSVDVLMRLGVAEADAFIGCWNAKFQYDLLRPVTYIRRTMDPKWESTLATPPFPEYPSGHSTQSAAAATVMTQAFGENFAFEDATNVKDGLKPRSFASFWAAANEAGISRLYGGIHYRAAIERGLEQGRCIGKFTTALKTRG